MWLFGDSFDHYAALTEKYSVAVGYGAIGPGRGRFGTNSLYFDASGSIIRTVRPGHPTAGAFLSLAMKVAPVATGDSFGFANLWNGLAGRGHVVFRYNVTEGSISAFRQYFNNNPLQTNFAVTPLGTTPPGLLLPHVWNSIECYAKVHATAGVVRVRINGAEVLTLTGLNTANDTIPNTAWTGWYQGVEFHVANVDCDDAMVYDDHDNGDGVTDFLGDLTGECLPVAGDGASSQWTRNTGPTNASCVDEIPADADATYVEAQAIGLVDTYTVAPLARVTDGIACVQVVTTARKTTGTRAVAGVLRNGGTHHLGPSVYLGSEYGVSVAAFPTEPSSGDAWTAGAVASSEIGQQVTV